MTLSHCKPPRPGYNAGTHILMASSSPQGRIFQVEYAAEAVKQGSVVVGIVSKTHAVLVAIKVRSPFTQAHQQSSYPKVEPPS